MTANTSFVGFGSCSFIVVGEMKDEDDDGETLDLYWRCSLSDFSLCQGIRGGFDA